MLQIIDITNAIRLQWKVANTRQQWLAVAQNLQGMWVLSLHTGVSNTGILEDIDTLQMVAITRAGGR